MNEAAFTRLVAELYARAGARVDTNTGSHQVDFILTDPDDYTDFIYGPVAVTCIQSQEQISYQVVSSVLNSTLSSSFDQYYLCTNSTHSLDGYTRDKLRSAEYPDDWFTLKNYTDITHLLTANDNDYLAYVYFELDPTTYKHGWRDEAYLADRLSLLGVETTNYTVSKLCDSGELLRDLSVTEKFVLSEQLTASHLAEHIAESFDKTHYIQFAVQNGRPSESTVNNSLFR